MVERLVAGDLRALARAISVVEDGGPLSGEVVRACRTVAKRSRRIGVTGSAGAGKSTLVDQMVRLLRRRGERVGVLAIDPSSPFTGGALLGDRIRMQGFTSDPGVFLRSMASRGELGGVSAGVAGAIVVLEAAGFATVIVETVGVGQDEVAVSGLVDVTALVLTPGMGDDVQSLKAGLMEAADAFVVNKADLDGAERVEAEIRAMQTLTGEQRPLVKTVATSGAGVSELLDVLENHRVDSADETAGMRAVSVDHLGVAVRSIESVRSFYEGLGVPVGRLEMVAHEQVRVAMLPLGDSRIELLEPTAEDSVIGRFLAKRGEGLHHLALRVDRLDERFAAMQSAGVRLASDAVRVGAGGHRYFFVHPATTGGVLIELVEQA